MNALYPYFRWMKQVFRWAVCVLAFVGMGGCSSLPKLKEHRLAWLPESLGESSGIVLGLNPGTFWSLNDGGNSASLMLIDSRGVLLQSRVVQGAQNVDWEELSTDGKHLFIGDFGNNGNRRRDLKIYVLAYPEVPGSDSLSWEEISFRFADQIEFPPPPARMGYDLEAMVVMDGEAHLFMKNRSEPFDGWLRRYRLSLDDPKGTAEKVDSVWTGGKNWMKASVCGAALSPDRSRLALVGYKRLWIWDGFQGEDFWKGKCQVYKLRWTQREAVAWLDNHSLVFTDERIPGFRRGALRMVRLP